jgi:TonB family protein
LRKRTILPVTFLVAIGVVSAPCLAIPPTLLEADTKSPVRLDKNHLPKVGHQYYPKESLKRGEQGICVVRAEVGDDGWIRATQLVYSSGFEGLDAACLEAYRNGHFLPATVNGTPIAKWIVLPTSWQLSRETNPNVINSPAVPKSDAQLSVPVIESHLSVGPDYYPDEARKMHLEGDCTVHALIAENGGPREVSVTKSTGFPTLDQACVLAIQQAQILPKKDKGIAVEGAIDINMSWRLLK